ncbi:hypothetical protein [Methylorubrum thiocyanatum]|uniref:hypothetical protein n=1 Tax=Methylorubrum thiocyanatum TaxID=47958 RepID=UPI0035C86E5C
MRWTQLDIFRDWRPPPVVAPAPAPATRPARRDDAERAMAAALHVAPDPRRVYALACSHGFDACCQRWSWLTRDGVSRLVNQGRALTRGTRSECVRRTLTLADEQRVVDAALALGGVAYAAMACGVPEGMVRTILRERGVDYPRASGRRQDAAAARERVAAYMAGRAA